MLEIEIVNIFMYLIIIEVNVIFMKINMFRKNSISYYNTEQKIGLIIITII